MCGIVGLYSKKDHITKEQFGIFIKILEATEPRGDDATGFSYIENGEIIVVKDAQKASEFVKKIELKDIKTKVLIGHCRKKTQGHQSNPLNNHPILYDDLSLVHNGFVYNDDDIFKENKLQRLGEVDSEAIVALVNHHSKNGEMEDAIEKAHKDLKGNFACLMISKDNPDKLYLWKTTNPAVFKETKDAFYISSTQDIINKVLLEGESTFCPIYDMFIFSDNKAKKLVNKIPRESGYTSRTYGQTYYGNGGTRTYYSTSNSSSNDGTIISVYGFMYEKGFFS